MLSLLASHLLASLHADLAFVARYYEQGTKPSYYRLYLADRDGKHLRRAPNTGDNIEEFFWVDHNHLAYVQYDRRFSAEASQRNVGIVLYDVESGTPKLLKKFVADQWVAEVDSAGHVVNINQERGYKVDSQGVTEVKASYPPGLYPEFGKSTPVDDDHTSVQANVGPFDLKYIWSDQGSDNASTDLTVTRGSTTKVYRGLVGNNVEAAFAESDTSVLAVLSQHFQKFNREYRVYRFDLTKSEPDVLVKDVGETRFSPTSPWYFGHQTTGKELGKLNNGKLVYINWLITGNWKTGEKWTVVKGLVAVNRAGFRPD